MARKDQAFNSTRRYALLFYTTIAGFGAALASGIAYGNAITPQFIAGSSIAATGTVILLLWNNRGRRNR